MPGALETALAEGGSLSDGTFSSPVFTAVSPLVGCSNFFASSAVPFVCVGTVVAVSAAAATSCAAGGGATFSLSAASDVSPSTYRPALPRTWCFDSLWQFHSLIILRWRRWWCGLLNGGDWL